MLATLVRPGTGIAVGASLLGALACGPRVIESPPPVQAPAVAAEQPVSPLPGDSSYVRNTPVSNPVLQGIWNEGMQNSKLQTLAQQLLDSIGPRLTGSPGSARGRDWLVSTYRSWGIDARQEEYGSWASWDRGVAHVDLISPRVRSLEATMLAWSPGTGGRAVEGDVIVLPDLATPEEYRAWLPQARGKFVLISPPRLSCRSQAQIEEYATPSTITDMRRTQDTLTQGWVTRQVAAGGPRMQETMKEAGVLGVFSTYWSGYPGIQKIFGSWNQQIPTFDITCEDYGLIYRLAAANQSPRVRMSAESESLGERPMFNVVAEMRGRELPNEYVLLSAHFDSWDGASGATDNGTGTLVMLEAMRILKQHYPNPRRTILVGHWGGEEQGLNGSRAFSEDHPEIVQGLQAVWNQDNGTGRVVNMSPGPFANARPVIAGYLSEIPSQITRHITLGGVGGQQTGGTDHASFQCHRAPAFNLGALSWDYGLTTWHTNRDTYDKVVFDDVKNNATLTAMLAYLASEDDQRMPREILNPLPRNPRTGQQMTWQECAPAVRKSQDSRR
ncbi:MAG TPA: M20/M25/M40 family metallo-hydrolase [Gemmatimonadales bacterium]|nr:M20/M25/M40 family metallo-hydrolase [Gemmatimonadales bacterium]